MNELNGFLLLALFKGVISRSITSKKDNQQYTFHYLIFELDIETTIRVQLSREQVAQGFHQTLDKQAFFGQRLTCPVYLRSRIFNNNVQNEWYLSGDNLPQIFKETVSTKKAA